MIDINPDILDEITRYVTDDLDPAAKSRIAEKIASDEVYQQHHTYYQTIVGALAREAVSDESGTVNESSEDDAYFDSLLTKDRKKANLHRTSYIAGFLIMAVASFFIGRFSTPTPSQPTTVNPPMANMEEEEEPLAAAGNALPITATIRKVRLAPTQILVATHREPGVKYLFGANRLRLFVPQDQQEELASARIEIIALEDDETIENYLRINDLYYSLGPNKEKQPLIPLEDEGILLLLK